MACLDKNFGSTPTEFGVLGTQVRSNDKVLAILKATYPHTLQPHQLVLQDAHGTILGQCDPPSDDIHIPEDFPPYMWARFDRAITKRTGRKLLERYEILQPLLHHTGPTGRDRNRDPTDACHFGVWEHYSAAPHVTSDSLKQSSEAIKALDGLLDTVSEEIAPIVNSLLQRHSPILYKKQQRFVFLSLLMNTLLFPYKSTQAISTDSWVPISLQSAARPLLP